jgi:hypothetical protein
MYHSNMAIRANISSDFIRIYGAANSGAMPSDSMPTRDHGEKSFAIAAFSQEMALAGLIRARLLGLSFADDVFESVRGGLLRTYTAAGFKDPAAILNLAEERLKAEISSPQNAGPGVHR